MPGESEAGYLLGVDVGTSNTVAVLRWPDGRTRPLLIGGQPLIPSAVHLGDSQRLVAGPDAARMAQLDPARHEPHPKSRIDEQVVLLGDAEVPVVHLLAAILREVAAGAVEAVGFLPPAILTHPAAWGPRRREVLQAAAGRAGWPPVSLVPEPVAAARYFSDVLRRPVPVGSALAVFDFGGGTVDVAVVRNEGARFAVLGSGGLEDLGGNDLDEALVDHLGAAISGSAPDVWRRLLAPRTQDDRRARRLFAEEVRGGKEMLSRSASAPVWIPGVEGGAHVTRDEFERVAAPLLHRAVAETGAVIGRCGLHPSQLTSLFLVGGSSRVPLVARMLHSQLGVAPTVLEQPELPVAEGALATVASPATAPVSPPVGMAGPAVGGPVGSPAGGARPVGPSSPAGGGRRPARKGLLRRPVTWVAAALAVVLAAAGTAYAVFRPPDTQDGFVAPLEPVAEPIAMNESARPAEDDTTGKNQAELAAGRAYFTVPMPEGKVEVVGADLESGRKLWRKTLSATLTPLLGGPDPLEATERAVFVLDSGQGPAGDLTPVGGDSGEGIQREVQVLDPKTGKELWKRKLSEAEYLMYFDTFVVLDDPVAGTLRKLDVKTGRELWKLDDAGQTIGLPVKTKADTRASSDYRGRVFEENPSDDYRVVQVRPDKSVQVVDTKAEKVVAEADGVADPTADLADPGLEAAPGTVVAEDGKLYVATRVSLDGPYRVDVYDLDTMGEPKTLYESDDVSRAAQKITPCGDGGVCVIDTVVDEAEASQPGVDAVGTDAEVVVSDGRGGEPVLKEMDGAQWMVSAGDNVLVANGSDSSLFDLDGNVLTSFTGTVLRLGRDRLVKQEGNPGFGAERTKLTGYAPGSTRPVELGEVKIRSDSCAWSEQYLACVTGRAYGIWRWAE
jgi:molecular chaperone HscA